MSEPTPNVWPSLRARDAHALIDFLVTAFGFEQVVAYESDGMIMHAELAWPPGGGIMLGQARDDGWKQQPGTFGAYVVCDDADALCERIRAAGGEIELEPYDTDYGSREFEARDPEGNMWSFGTYRGHPR